MIFLGNGIVWNKETNKKLCKFIDGQFYTDDIYIIDKLKALNYKYDEIEVIEEVKEIPQKKVRK